MDNQVLDPDGARERLTAWKGRIDKLAADTKAMSDRMQALQETVTDPRGMVKVTVDSTGSLIGLQLTPQINGVPPELVARTIMDTVRRAKARLAERSREVIEETLGADSAAGQAIADSVGRHLRADDVSDEVTSAAPARPAAPPPSAEPAAPRRRPTPRDDDDDEEPFELKL